MVSNELKDEFLYELWEGLERAGLRPDPDAIIGHKYVFKCCDNGPLVCGTITAIGISDLRCIPIGLDLYVSSPEVYGEKIRCIVRTQGGWAIEVYTADKKPANKFFYGELQLFFQPMPHAPDAYNNRIFKA